MKAHPSFSHIGTGSPSTTRRSLAAGLRSLKAFVVTWRETCARYQEAAALYQQLSCLSDAELRRRGVSRATLAWEICQACAPGDASEQNRADTARSPAGCAPSSDTTLPARKSPAGVGTLGGKHFPWRLP
jgi:hypothetical protein